MENLLHYANLFSPNDYENNGKILYKYFKDKYVKSQVQFIQKDETRNCRTKEIKTTCKKTYNYLNYVERLLILVSTVTGCVSISAFSSLVYVPVAFTSSAVGKKIVQS